MLFFSGFLKVGLTRLGFYKVQPHIVEDPVDLGCIVGKHYQFDLARTLFVADRSVQQAMVFRLFGKFFHTVFWHCEELEGAALFQHPHQLCFSSHFLLVIQNRIHKKCKVLRR